MAFDADSLTLQVDAIGGGGLRIYTYQTNDVLNTLVADGYVQNALKRGLKVGDLIIAQVNTDDNHLLTLESFNADGDGTLIVIDENSSRDEVFLPWRAGVADWGPEIAEKLTLAVSEGKHLQLGEGTFNVATVVPVIDNMDVRGAGKYKTILLSDTTTPVPIFQAAGGTFREHVRISDMTLDGQADEQAIGAGGIHLLHAYDQSDWIVRRVRFQNSLGYGAGLQGFLQHTNPNQRGPQNDITFEECDFIRCAWPRTMQTTLIGAIDADDLVCEVASVTGLDTGGGHLRIMYNNGTEDVWEVLGHGQIVGGNTTLNLTRARLGTTAAAHPAGATVIGFGSNDGIDIKSSNRVNLINCTSQYCSGRGANPRSRICNVINWRDTGSTSCIVVNAIGETDSVSSTLSGAVTATQDTMPLVSASAFPTAGEGKVDSESFSWTGKSTNTLTGVLRGLDGSIAIAHDSAAIVGLNLKETDYDTVIVVKDCWGDRNDGNSFVVSSGSSHATARVLFEGCTSLESGAGFTGSGGGLGAISLTIRDFRCERTTQDNPAVYVGNVDHLIIDGLMLLQNAGKGLHLENQSNGGLINNVITIGNTWGILETGDCDWLQYGLILARDNSQNLSICLGANSSWSRREQAYGLNQNTFTRSYQVSEWPAAGATTIGANDFEEFTVSDATVEAGALVEYQFSPVLPAGLFIFAKAQTGHVKFTIFNLTAAPADVPSGTLRIYHTTAISLT